jgi:hypothetical protein
MVWAIFHDRTPGHRRAQEAGPGTPKHLKR